MKVRGKLLKNGFLRTLNCLIILLMIKDLNSIFKIGFNIRK